MNTASIFVFDFETGGKDPRTCVPIQLAARVYNPRTLELAPGGTFASYMRPKDDEWDKLEQGAMDINKISRDTLKDAPEREQVWLQFVEFVNRFNPKPGDVWRAPIAAGFGITNYDLTIIDRFAQQHGNIDKEGKANLFNRRFMLDLLFMLFPWFENVNLFTRSWGFDAVREKFGISKEGAHNAIVDVQQEGDLLMRFLRMNRTQYGRVVWPWLKEEAKAA